MDLLRDFSGDTGDQFSFRDDVLQSLCIEVADSSGKLGAGGGCLDVCNRTPAVRDAIVAAVSGVSECGKVSTADLKGITTLTLAANSLQTSGLKAGDLEKTGDFEGLTGLITLNLSGAGLTELPAGIFEPLTALGQLFLRGNDLSALPADIFDNLTELFDLNLRGNDLSALPADIFDNLAKLYDLNLGGNDLSVRPGTL